MNILKYLAEWREIECKKRNIPKNRLIKDEVLVILSQLKPVDICSIRKIRGMPKILNNKDINKILETIKFSCKIEPKK